MVDMVEGNKAQKLQRTEDGEEEEREANPGRGAQPAEAPEAHQPGPIGQHRHAREPKTLAPLPQYKAKGGKR